MSHCVILFLFDTVSNSRFRLSSSFLFSVQLLRCRLRHRHGGRSSSRRSGVCTACMCIYIYRHDMSFFSWFEHVWTFIWLKQIEIIENSSHLAICALTLCSGFEEIGCKAYHVALSCHFKPFRHVFTVVPFRCTSYMDSACWKQTPRQMRHTNQCSTYKQLSCQ